MILKFIFFIICVILGRCEGAVWGPERAEDQCEAAIKETIHEDRATIVDDTASRLHFTWLSQECEVRAGPEYVIRKYSFFENGTFLLIRHHYAEESCSVAMYTVAARGIIRLLSNSNAAPGATEARYQLDRVHIVPLTRQVAQKFSHRVNVSCTPQPRWRPYVPQLIYEQPSRRFSNFLWEGPKYNAFQRYNPLSRKHRGLDCLEPLGIEFGELRLVRVEKKRSTSTAFALGSNGTPKIELFLASLPPNVFSKKTHRPTSLQPTALLRADATRGCLVCGAISRGTESSPPLLHEVAALPALLGGSWLSSSCESCQGGMWIKRQLEIYAGDMLWTGRWDYYADPKCMNFLYAVTAAGSYIQRAGRQRRHGESKKDLETFIDIPEEEEEEEEEEEFQDKKRFFRVKRKSEKMMKLNENLEKNLNLETENEYLDEERFLRSKKALAEWMTPELAGNLFEIYGSKKDLTEEMLPTVEEIRQAIESSELLPNLSKTENKRNSLTPNLSFLKNDDQESIFNNLESETNESDPQKKRDIQDTLNDVKVDSIVNKSWRKSRRSLESDDSYRHLLQNSQPSMADAFAAILRGNQRRDETTKKPTVSEIPTGTTELDLHVAESLLIAGDLGIADKCGAPITADQSQSGNRNFKVRPISNWPRSCVQHSLEAPSTLGLRARVGVNWSGQYTLLLGPRDDHLWETPLHQCGPTPSHNPILRAHLRRSVGLRYGLYTSASSVANPNCNLPISCWIFKSALLLFLYLLR